jgi:ISXO2-like transposase domain
MHTIDVLKKFNTEAACLDYLESLRWAENESMVCRGCGLVGRENFRTFTTNETTRTRISRKTGNARTVKVPSRRLHECKGCGRQMSVKNDTVFGWTHLPLDKWFMAVAMMLEAKKGISAMQVCRHLGLDPKRHYKSVWYLCHRIREAMIEAGLLAGTVEVDETYFTPRKPRKGNPPVKKEHRDVVLGMVERGGRVRFAPIKDAKVSSIEPQLQKHVSPDAFLQTDGGPSYYIIGQKGNFSGHRMIDHIKSYGQGENHTNTVENAFSLLKRGVYGTFHNVSIRGCPSCS